MYCTYPLSRIIRLEGDGDVSIARHEDDIPARWIVVLESAIREIVRMESAVLLCEQHKVVPVQMHWVCDGDEMLVVSHQLRGVADRGHDDVDPVALVVVFRDEGVFRVVPARVAEVVDQWVAEVEPHGQVIGDKPPGEIAMGCGMLPGGDVEADFEVVACVGVD